MSARSSRTVLAGTLIGLSVLVSACQDTAATGTPQASRSRTAVTDGPSSTPEPTPAVLAIAPADKATGVLPNATVSVAATTGTVSSVALTDGAGAKISGRLDATGVWKPAGRLTPDTAYTLSVAAVGPDGTQATTTSTFRTLKPTVTATYGLIGRSATVGVGMPVIVQFDSAVSTKAQRAEVEKNVKVVSSPAQPGSWGWLDGRQLMFRPASYWKPGTTLSLQADVAGLQTGTGKWIAKNDSATWNVGSSMISSVDMNTHRMTVRRNGEVIRTFSVSTGKPGPLTETRYGTKVIIERNSAITMDSATVGIPKGSKDYYKIDTKWNLRLTWTGEFIHSAPWSTSAQGTANVSHGCTNMSPANAEWMFRSSKMGDVVKFTGSSRAFQPTEGIGVWVYSYAGWKAQSALA